MLNRVRVSKHLGLADLVKRTVEATAEDHLAAFAGSLTYHGLFAIFPFLLFLLSLLTLFDVTHLVDALLFRAQTTLPPPAVLLLQEQLVKFLGEPDAVTREFYLPGAVSAMVTEGAATVQVVPTDESWFGVTYREDRPAVATAIATQVAGGAYPSPLWTPS